MRSMLLLALLLVAACGGSDSTGSSPTSSMDGLWYGQAFAPPPASALRSIELMLRESHDSITGAATFTDRAGDVTANYGLLGTLSQNTVTLSLYSMVLDSMSITGRLTNDSTIAATMNGSGWLHTPVTFTKK